MAKTRRTTETIHAESRFTLVQRRLADGSIIELPQWFIEGIQLPEHSPKIRRRQVVTPMRAAARYACGQVFDKERDKWLTLNAQRELSKAARDA